VHGVRGARNRHESSVGQELGGAASPRGIDEGVALAHDYDGRLSDQREAILDAIREDHARGCDQVERSLRLRSSHTLDDQ
jgi:hypothetical protein